MPTSWRTVRVFISSTFRDMQAERDHLVRFVFPRLREALLPRRIHLVDVDLRWGVTSEQDALEVCREIIDECQPRFVCILGGRYGWVPPGREHSITADEVRYGVLERLGVEEYRYFYFRRPQATDSIPEEAARAGGYREFATPEDIQAYGLQRAEELARQRTQKLADLKQAVVDAGFEPFIYQARWDPGSERLVGLEAFGERVHADLLASIDDEFGVEAPVALDEFAEEDAAMEGFVQERVERYVVGSRQGVFDQLADFAQGDGEPSIALVTGAPGCGKSALLGRFTQDYAIAHPDELVITHFVGASAGSTDLRRTLRRLCHALAQTAGAEGEIPQEVKELVPRFAELLGQAAQSRRVVLILDALNQLDPTDNAHSMYWLPRSLPANVRVIVSSLEHPALEAVRRRGEAAVLEIPVEPLVEADGRAIIQEVLRRYRKRMSEEQVAALLGKAEAGSPLYLLAALEELRTLGTYEEITDRIRELPDEVRPLFVWILERLEGDPGFRDAEGRLIGPDVVRKFVSLLGVSRHGLSQTELAELIAPGDPQADPPVPADAQGNVAALQRLLQPYLMRRGDLLDFYHSQLRGAVEGEYLDEEQERLDAHRALADYFRRKADPAGDSTWTGNHPRGLSELPYHQTHGELWPALEATLTDLLFIEAKCTAGMTYDLIGDYDSVGAGRMRPGPPIRTAWLHQGRYGVWCPFCLAWGEVHATHLSQAIRCPACNRDLKLNAFAVRAQWRPSGAERQPEAMEQRMTATVSRAVAEFGDFVRNAAYVLRQQSELTSQQAHNCANGSAPNVAADGRWSSGVEIRPWLRWVNKPLRPGACLATLGGDSDSRIAGVCLYSPDGSHIMSTFDGPHGPMVKILDAERGEEVSTARGVGYAWAPDGRSIVFALDDGTLQVRDTEGVMRVTMAGGHGDHINACALSPDGRRIVSASADGTLKVWDARNGQEVFTLEGHRYAVYACAYSPNGRRIVSGSGDNTLIVWDAQSGAPIALLEGHMDSVTGCAYSPDGRRIVSSSSDGTLRLWDAAAGEKLPRHPLLMLKVWDAKSRVEIATLGGHAGEVCACAWSPDGRKIVSGSRDNTLRVWDPDSGEETAILIGHSDAVQACSFSPDARRILSGAWDNSCKVWDVESAGDGEETPGPSGALMGDAYCANGWRIVCARADGTLEVWDAEGGRQVVALKGHRDRVTACACSPDGRRFASGESGDDALRIWDAETGEEIARLPGHQFGVSGCAYAPDGTRVVSGSLRGEINVWNLEGPGNRIGITAAAEPEPLGVTGLALSPDGGRVLAQTGAYVATMRLLESESGRSVATLTGRTSLSTGLPFSPDGKRVVSGLEDGTVTVWDTDRGERVATLRGHVGPVTACAYSPDGQRIVSGSRDGALIVWDGRNGAQMAVIKAHSDDVTTCAYSPDGLRIISASRDKTLRIWDAQGWKEVATFVAGGSICAVASAPSGRTLAAETSPGIVCLLRLEGLEFSPPVLTAWRWPGRSNVLSRRAFLCPGRKELLAFGCPLCREWSEAPQAALGTELPCPKCGRAVKLNPFVIEADWRPVAAAWRGEPNEG